jgi:lactoylglutathione lyase
MPTVPAPCTTIVEDPADRPWGERVARVLDPDGNEVLIGQRSTDT